MVSELEVRNQFREVILHISLTSGDVPALLTISATDEMRSAVASLIGEDFDRTIGNGNRLQRFTARWGTPEYPRVLAEYFGNNFGWSTSLVETEHPSSVATRPDYYEPKWEARSVVAGAEANGFGYAEATPSAISQIGGSLVINACVAGLASQQSTLGEL
jgi:hypothetical protein